MTGKLDRFLILCGVFGTPIFLLFTFLLRLIYPYQYLNQTISSLGALDSPVKTLANLFIFNLFGILISLFAVGVFKSQEIKVIGKIGAIFFFLAGISMFLVGIFPGSSGHFGPPTPGDAIHNKFAFYPFPLMAIGFVLFAADIFANRKLWWLVFPIVLVGPIGLILRYYTTQFPFPYYIGVLQLLAIGLPFLVMMLIAMAMYLKESGGIYLVLVAIAVAATGIVGLAAGIDTTSERTGIPYLCTSESNCRDFCQSNRGGCTQACAKYPESPVCQKLF